jgi:predicted metallo-beta-lactamase superfamily hydrolase
VTELEQGLRNLEYIVESVPLVILDHHVLRDEAWQQKISSIYQQSSKAGHSVMTAAEYAGQENLFLEANRKQLFRDHPPSSEFKAWMKTLNGKVIAKPPIQM